VKSPSDGKQPNHTTIDKAVKTYLAEFSEHAAFATQKKYRLMLNKLTSFSEQRGYVMIDQWGPSDVREFRSSWNVSARTAPRRMSMVRSFFEYCLSNEWMDRNPARTVKNPKTRDSGDGRNEQKLPSAMKRSSACTMPAQNTGPTIFLALSLMRSCSHSGTQV
jgi:site-specific recombinase XerD